MRTCRYPYVLVKNAETGEVERHHEDKFFDELTDGPWRKPRKKEVPDV